MTAPDWSLLPKESLAARALRATSADKRIAELESQLGLLQEELSRRENEVVSLQKSLELNAGENSRLLGLVDGHSAEAEKAKSQFDRLASALAREKRDRDEANQRQRAETSELRTHLEVALARANAAEKLLSQAQHDLSACRANNAAIEQKFADAESASRDREQKLAEAEGAVQEREQRIADLTRSRSLLIDELGRLQTTSKVRDEDFARARQNQSLLADLVVQLEAKVKKSRNDANSAESEPQLQQVRESFANGRRTHCAVLKRDLDSDAWLLGPSPLNAA